MYGGHPAGSFDFGVACVQFRNAKVVSDTVVEKVGFLRDEAFDFAQVRRIDPVDGSVRDFNRSRIRVAKAHEELQQRRFSASAPSGNSDNRSEKNFDRNVLQDFFFRVGKRYVFSGGSAEAHGWVAVNFLNQRFFVQNVENAVPSRKGILKRGSESGERDRRPERREQRDRRDEDAAEINASASEEDGSRKEHQ